MTNDAKRLIKAFLSLSDDGKKEVSDFIKEYSNLNWSFEKKAKEEKFLNESRTLGPISSATCPYCSK